MSKPLPHPPKIHPTFIPTTRPAALSLPGAKKYWHQNGKLQTAAALDRRKKLSSWLLLKVITSSAAENDFNCSMSCGLGLSALTSAISEPVLLSWAVPSTPQQEQTPSAPSTTSFFLSPPPHPLLEGALEYSAMQRGRSAGAKRHFKVQSEA